MNRSRSRRSTLALLIALSALALAAVVLGAPGESSKKGRSPATVVRTYFNAYNKADGTTMCSNFTPELRSWFERIVAKIFFGRRYPCDKAVVGMIGYTEDAGYPKFARLKVLAVSQHVTGSFAEVDVTARYHYSSGEKDLISPDKIFLFKRQGRWLIAKPGAVYWITQSASGAPSSMANPPIPDKGSNKPAPQPPANFSCDASFDKETDPADAPKPLDIRTVWASSNSDGSHCLGFTFSAPPRPGTELSLDIEVNALSGGQTGADASVRIGRGGKIYFSGDVGPSPGAGWKNGQLLIRWPPINDQASDKWIMFNAQASSLQIWEPEIKHPLKGQDEFDTELGHES